MIISLTGFMACGKTTVGRCLANLLGVKFVDLDEQVAATQGMSVQQIFAEKGEAFFRSCEYQCLSELIAAEICCKSEAYCLEDQRCNNDYYLNNEANTQIEQHRDNNQITMVIALGGGAITNEKTRDLILNKTKCIYIQLSLETILKRLEKVKTVRPLAAYAPSLYAARESLYSQAHIIVDGENQSPHFLANLLYLALANG